MAAQSHPCQPKLGWIRVATSRAISNFSFSFRQRHLRMPSAALSKDISVMACLAPPTTRSRACESRVQVNVVRAKHFAIDAIYMCGNEAQRRNTCQRWPKWNSSAVLVWRKQITAATSVAWKPKWFFIQKSRATCCFLSDLDQKKLVNRRLAVHLSEGWRQKGFRVYRRSNGELAHRKHQRSHSRAISASECTRNEWTIWLLQQRSQAF